MIRPRRCHSRGFLLLVVIGVLAVLTVVCVGFLSYTRGEVDSVSSQRDKSDGMDVVHTAIDWTMANIAKDIMATDAGNPNLGPCIMDPNQTVAQVTNQGGAGYRWWYRPNEMGLGAFINKSWWSYTPVYMNPNTTEAPWTYLPADFFPGGAVRGRFAVQVLDPNAVININDWNEDCNPSQAQMAHMLMDGVTMNWWAGSLESYRKWRDTGSKSGSNCPMRYQEAWRAATHTQRYLWWIFYNNWNSVQNVVSYDWVTTNTSWFAMSGPDWTCLHTSYQSDGIPQGFAPPSPAPNYGGATHFYPTDAGSTSGYAGAGQGTPWGYNTINSQHFTMSGFTTQAYVDPDTGRSPVNVNTCYNSGEVYPVNWWDGVPTYTMEAVWNVESLRRLIKVGYFWTGTCFKNAQTQWMANGGKPSPAATDPLTDDEKMKVEQLKTKLAYQYQETLCRYFTGTYSHNNGRKWAPTSGTAIKTFSATYPTVGQPKHACTVTDYSAARFNCSLTQFRSWVRDDLVILETGATKSNPSFNPTPSPYPLPPGQFGPDHTDGTVSFDNKDNPEVAPGKLDMRVAAACYDNLYPGKPTDMNTFNGCKSYQASAAYPDGDPIYELYVMQLGRQEDIDDKYNIDPRFVTGKGYDDGTGNYNPTPNLAKYPANNNIYGYWADNCSLPELVGYPINPGPMSSNQMLCQNDHFGSAYSFGQPGSFTTLNLSTPNVFYNAGNAQNVCAKGRDICVAAKYSATDPMGPWIDNQIDPASSDPNNNHVPWRQLCFSSDSFSTELTTTSNTFILIINASLVDQASVVANPTDPTKHRQLFWNQWGAVVELSPGIMSGVTGAGGANTYSVADPSPYFPRDPKANAAPPYLIPGFSTARFPYALNPFPADSSSPANQAYPMYSWWYRNDMPQATKTDANGMDDCCPTLVSRNRDENESGANIRTQNRWGRDYNVVINDPPGTKPIAGPPFVTWTPQAGVSGATYSGTDIPGIDPEYSNATFITDWKSDIRGVPPAGDPSGRGTDVVYGIDKSGVPNQARKRIFIRSIWCLNQNVFQ